MDKKRKRPSFTISSTPVSKPSTVQPEEDQASMKQVVEVVVPKAKPGETPTPVNIVIPPQSVVVQKKEAAAKEPEPIVEELPVVDGVDDEPLKFNDRAQELIDEDDSTVTASATPEGDTVVVREDAEESEEKVPPVRQTVEVVKEDQSASVPVVDEEESISTDIEEESNIEPVEDATQAKPPITVHKSPTGETSATEKQQEQVAELFGKSSQSVMPEITVHHHSNTKGIILWAITMIAVALGVGGGLVLFTSRNTQTTPVAVTTPTPTAGAQIVPTATPTPVVVDKKEITIQVLNGGGVAGAGSRMKSFLEELGYTVVEAKNADAYTYETTDIIIKSSKAEALDTIKKDIAESYEVGETEITLPESTAYDVRVIVGENE